MGLSLIRPSTGSILLPLPTIDQGDSAGTTPERAEARPTNGSEACEFGAGFGEAGVGEGFAPGHRGVDGPQIHRYCDFMRNLTISVDDAVYRRAHKKAAAEETSLSRVVQHFLERGPVRTTRRPRGPVAAAVRGGRHAGPRQAWQCRPVHPRGALCRTPQSLSLIATCIMVRTLGDENSCPPPRG